jgi:hypothetical protein
VVVVVTGQEPEANLEIKMKTTTKALLLGGIIRLEIEHDQDQEARPETRTMTMTEALPLGCQLLHAVPDVENDRARVLVLQLNLIDYLRRI